jgi:protein-disulfide isomerase
MTVSRILQRGVVVLLLAAFPAQAWSQSSDSSQVVAEVGNHKLTLGKLQEQDAGKLLAARYALYQAEVAAVQALIDQALVKDQARKEGISVPELFKRHVESKVKDPTDDQMKVAYEILQTTQPYSNIRAKLLEVIRNKREEKVRAEYIASLRAAKTITVLLEPPTAEVALYDAPIRGQSSAPVLLIEFADYQCPYCQRMEPTLQKLQAKYGNKLKFSYKSFPLPNHPYAEKAAEAARCAGLQGKYWQYHDVLYKDGKLAVPALKEQAKSLGLNSEKFNQCLDSSAQAAAVAKDLAEGETLGITGTPSFFVNGHFVSGAVGPDVLRDLIDQELVSTGDHLPKAAAGVQPAQPEAESQR